MIHDGRSRGEGGIATPLFTFCTYQNIWFQEKPCKLETTINNV
jgi:hypothetical protein